jgi:hypothetical protein
VLSGVSVILLLVACREPKWAYDTINSVDIGLWFLAVRFARDSDDLRFPLVLAIAAPLVTVIMALLDVDLVGNGSAVQTDQCGLVD